MTAGESILEAFGVESGRPNESGKRGEKYERVFHLEIRYEIRGEDVDFDILG